MAGHKEVRIQGPDVRENDQGEGAAVAACWREVGTNRRHVRAKDAQEV